MVKVDKGMPIGDWTRKYAYRKKLVANLADHNGVTTSLIYQYINATDAGDKDIRVIGEPDMAEIYEVRRLGK